MVGPKGIDDWLVGFSHDGVNECRFLLVTNSLEVGGRGCEVFQGSASFDKCTLEDFTHQQGKEVEAAEFVSCLDKHVIECDILEVQGQSQELVKMLLSSYNCPQFLSLSLIRGPHWLAVRWPWTARQQAWNAARSIVQWHWRSVVEERCKR